jgi:hypothetical protein
MRQETVQNLRFGLGDRFMRLRQFLQVVHSMEERVVVALGQTGTEHVQDHLRIFGIVLVPAVVDRLACTGERDRGDKANLETSIEQPPRQRSMMLPVASRATITGLPAVRSNSTKRSCSSRVLGTVRRRRRS